MKGRRQLSGFDHYSRAKLQKRNARCSERRIDPSLDVPVEYKPPVLNQLGHFPAGNDTYSENAVDAISQKVAMACVEPIRLRNPPNPDVRVKQGHRTASQSSLATGSKGSR